MDKRLEIVEFIVKRLVEKPEAVEVSEQEDQDGIEVMVKVDPADVGHLIGKRGSTINAVRSLVTSLDGEENTKIEIVE